MTHSQVSLLIKDFCTAAAAAASAVTALFDARMTSDIVSQFYQYWYVSTEQRFVSPTRYTMCISKLYGADTKFEITNTGLVCSYFLVRITTILD